MLLFLFLHFTFFFNLTKNCFPVFYWWQNLAAHRNTENGILLNPGFVCCLLSTRLSTDWKRDFLRTDPRVTLNSQTRAKRKKAVIHVRVLFLRAFCILELKSYSAPCWPGICTAWPRRVKTNINESQREKCCSCVDMALE